MIETDLKPNKVTGRVANGSRHGGSYRPQPAHSSALCATGTSCSFVKFVSFPLGPPLINKSSFQLIRFSPQLVKKLDTTHSRHVLQNSKRFEAFQTKKILPVCTITTPCCPFARFGLSSRNRNRNLPV